MLIIFSWLQYYVLGKGTGNSTCGTKHYACSMCIGNSEASLSIKLFLCASESSISESVKHD